MSNWAASSAEIAALIMTELSETAVREVGDNNGAMVRTFQASTGNAPPDSWCMSFQVWSMLKVFGNRFPPLPKSGRVQTVREAARKLGWISRVPKSGAIGLLIDTVHDHAHHTFLVTGVTTTTQQFPTVEGNTNPDGSSNGYGVFARARRLNGSLTYEFIHLPMKAA